jgi:hypothetical protein
MKCRPTNSKCYRASKYFENVNQDQSYWSMKIASRCRIASGVSALTVKTPVRLGTTLKYCHANKIYRNIIIQCDQNTQNFTSMSSSLHTCNYTEVYLHMCINMVGKNVQVVHLVQHKFKIKLLILKLCLLQLFLESVADIIVTLNFTRIDKINVKCNKTSILVRKRHTVLFLLNFG